MGSWAGGPSGSWAGGQVGTCRVKSALSMLPAWSVLVVHRQLPLPGWQGRIVCGAGSCWGLWHQWPFGGGAKVVGRATTFDMEFRFSQRGS